MNRRGLLLGLLTAPAIIRTAGLLMPVRPVPTDLQILDLEVGDYFVVVNGDSRIHRVTANSSYSMVYQHFDFGTEVDAMSRDEIRAALRGTQERTVAAMVEMRRET